MIHEQRRSLGSLDRVCMGRVCCVCLNLWLYNSYIWMSLNSWTVDASIDYRRLVACVHMFASHFVHSEVIHSQNIRQMVDGKGRRNNTFTTHVHTIIHHCLCLCEMFYEILFLLLKFYVYFLPFASHNLLCIKHVCIRRRCRAETVPTKVNYSRYVNGLIWHKVQKTV